MHSRNWRQDMPRHTAPRHGVPVPCHRMPPTACRCRARPCRRMVAHGSSWRRPYAACREVAQARVHWRSVPCGTMEYHALAQASMRWHGVPCTGAACHSLPWSPCTGAAFYNLAWVSTHWHSRPQRNMQGHSQTRTSIACHGLELQTLLVCALEAQEVKVEGRSSALNLFEIKIEVRRA
jgi:hypothetical protein